MKELLQQIYILFSGDSTLQTALGSPANKGVFPETNNLPEQFPCVTYILLSSSENTVPANTQESTIEMRTFSNVSKKQAEDINSRIKTLMKYYTSDTPNRVYWSIKNLELDNPLDDRNLYCKVLRYTIWTKI